MKESKDRIIEIQDVTPHTYEDALYFAMEPFTTNSLRDEEQSKRTMTIVDAVCLARFYHMYDFHVGKAKCDQVIAADFDLTDYRETVAYSNRYTLE